MSGVLYPVSVSGVHRSTKSPGVHYSIKISGVHYSIKMSGVYFSINVSSAHYFIQTPSVYYTSTVFGVQFSTKIIFSKVTLDQFDSQLLRHDRKVKIFIPIYLAGTLTPNRASGISDSGLKHQSLHRIPISTLTTFHCSRGCNYSLATRRVTLQTVHTW